MFVNLLLGWVRVWFGLRDGACSLFSLFARSSRVVCLFALLSPSLCVHAATYYAAPNGLSGNSGLSTNSPWPLAWALSHAGPNTILLMDGLYTGGPWTISQPNQTIKAINKWGPKFYNIAGGNGVFSVPNGIHAHGVVIDGLSFSNCQYQAVLFRDVGLSNCVVRNVWVQHTGKTFPKSQSASGITSMPGLNLLVENCLLEWNGTNNPGFNHGIYTGGTNGVYRNNISRHNGGMGIILNGHSNVDKNNRFYGNLLYGNYGMSEGYPWKYQLALYSDQAHTWTNYVYNNTLISDGGWAIVCYHGCAGITNNIIVSTNQGIKLSSVQAAWAGYNLAPRKLGTPGLGDVITNYFGFLKPSSGLYWLTSDSPARGKALSTVAAPTTFFGTSQSSVMDIGAFQYDAAYDSDSRSLDPSQANPDYWQVLPQDGGAGSGLVVSPNIQSFGEVQVGSSVDRTFTVTNSSSSSLSGTASVSAPFRIVSGASYSLAAGQSQTFTARFSPTAVGTNTGTIVLTGASGAKVSVSGIGTAEPPPPQSLRVIATL